ncbi:MAG TPA: PAS domain S-box protein, partial [Candidatus Limnocylindria bacterium]|nr:PAS domain S-box protein [Candidatus Limnocylindria bacterium]
MIPDTVLLCLFLISINENIHFARWERYGNQYQRPLEELLHYLPDHLLIARRPPAERNRRSAELGQIASHIDQAMVALERTDAEIGDKLQFTDEGLAKRKREHYRVRNLKAEWLSLKRHLAELTSEEQDRQHLHLIADVRTMITHAGDSSNLILDPDLDSYYLMDVTLLALPEMQDRLATVMAYGEAALESRTITRAEQSQLAVFAALLQESDLDRVRSSTRTALTEDVNFYGVSPSLQHRVPPALAEFSAAAENFIGLVSRLSATNRPTIAAADFLSAGARARQASFALWKVAAEESDVLLETRIDHYGSRRARSLILTALALTAAVSFVTFITRSISRPLQRQAAELKDSNRALQAEITERQRAENALRTAEEKYRSIFENASEGIYQTTVDGNYLVANRTLAHIYGYDSVAEMQASLTDIGSRLYVDPQRRAEFQRRTDQQGEVHEFESQVYRKDGQVIWISEHARAVRDDSGAVLYYEGTVADITERKGREAELAQLQQELIDTSRLAGMAEVATGVLHNVGNVLNSVNVATSDVRSRIEKSRLAHLRKIVELLGEHRDDLPAFLATDPKGMAVPSFLERLTAVLEEEHRGLATEMEAVAKHVDHIKQIVSMQQHNARIFGSLEQLQPRGLVEEALQLTGESFDRHAIIVERDFASPRSILADRHKVLQIMVNLLG